MNNKKVGIDDIVVEGQTILSKSRQWINDKHLDKYMKDNNIKKVNKMTKNDYNKINSDYMSDNDYKNLHNYLIKEHHDFASIYAICIRSIVYHNIYYDDVMRKYVNHLTNNPWQKKEEFIERQAEYLVIMEKHKRPRMGSSELGRYKANVIKTLMEEDKTFDKYAKEVQATMDVEIKEIQDNRKKRLHDILQQMKKEKDSSDTASS